MAIVFSVLFYILTLMCPRIGGSEGQKTLDMAKELLNKGKTTESINLLMKYNPSVEELSGYHYTLAKAFEKAMRSQDYIEHLRLAYIYSTAEQKPQLLLERAEAYMRTGYFPEATIVFKLLLKNSNISPQEASKAYIGLGEALYNTGRYEESINYFSKGGDRPDALYGRAKSLQAAGKTEEAYETFMKALLTDKDFLKSSEETLYRLGENLMMVKRYEEAKQYLKLIRDAFIKTKAELLLGIISSEQKRYDEALRYLNSVLNSGNLTQGNRLIFRNVIRDIKRRALYQIAMIYIDLGKKKEAEEKLLDIRLHYPYGECYERAILSLARLYRESGHIDKAMPLLKELAFRRSPGREVIDEFESIILSATENKEGLIKLWDSIGHWLLEPSRSEKLIKVAEALRGTGAPFVKLITWLKKYGDNNAREKAGLLLASFYADYGDSIRAEESLKSLKTKAVSKSDDVYRIRSKVSLLNGNLKDAINSFLSIREFNSEDINLIASMIDSVRHKNSNDLKRLLDRYERLIDKGDTADHVRLADVLYSLSRKDDALLYYRKVISEKKGPVNDADRDWASYRILISTKERDVIQLIKGDRLKRLGTLVSREIDIDRTIEEVF
ncbi:MAG: tetratricopeptide repeat protein [Thermodesulfovibrionales bacterium]